LPRQARDEHKKTLQKEIACFAGAAEKVDARRVLVLRTASDYTAQHDGGMTATDVYFRPCPSCPKTTDSHDGFRASVETAYVVAGAVVEALLDGWGEFEGTVPGS
jgi:purine nucleoside permease